MRYLVASYLSKLGHSCLTAVDGVDAPEKIKGNKIDAVITDIKLPKMDGMTLIGEISRQYPGLPVMVMTAFDEESYDDMRIIGRVKRHASGEKISLCPYQKQFEKRSFSLKR